MDIVRHFPIRSILFSGNKYWRNAEREREREREREITYLRILAFLFRCNF